MLKTRVGYAGGKKVKPTYHDLGDHTESLEVEYDPSVISYEKLLDVFWSAHDPRRPVGNVQYRSAIFVHDEAQRKAAEASKAAREKDRGATMHTAIETATPFTAAEDYHQKWYLRRSRDLVARLVGLAGDERALIDSTLAMRLNAYFGNHVDAAAISAELARLPVDAATVDAVMASVRAAAGDL